MSFLPVQNEKTFNVRVFSKTMGTYLEGSFSVKLALSNREMVDIVCKTDRFNQGSTSLPVAYALFNRSMAELSVRITNSPDWWKKSNNGWELGDPEVINEIYDRMADCVAEYKKQLEAAAEAAEKNEKKPDPTPEPAAQ